MNRNLKDSWQHLRSELRHWSHGVGADLDWIDDRHDYSRGRVAVHLQRAQQRDRLGDGDLTHR